MQVVFHMGVHCTDEDQLVRSLSRNAGRLAEAGVVVPEPGRYRPILGQTLQNLKDKPADSQLQETLLDAMTDHDDPKRLILSSETFLGATGNAVGKGGFYPRSARKSRWFPQLFPDAACEFHLAVRNPAAFLPALCARQKDVDFETMMDGNDPLALRWSDLVIRLRDANPDVPITVWCDEDTPLIWPDVLMAAAGLEPDSEPLEGGNDRLNGLMSKAGQERLTSYLESHPPLTAEHRRRIVAAFLDKFGLDEAMELELDLPGWTNDYVAALTDAYEEDATTISRLDGVRFISY